MDQAVNRALDDLEARFIRVASTWHLPFFYRRRDQAASDFTFIAPRAEAAVEKGLLPPELAAAALDYYGQVRSACRWLQSRRPRCLEAPALGIVKTFPGKVR
jgi:hypothetical protein